MRRIIGTIGATLAVVATMAAPAAAQDRGDRDRNDRDAGRILYATTNQNLLLNFDERRPDLVVDPQQVLELEPADGNPRRTGPETLEGIDFDAPIDRIRVTSNTEPDDDSGLLGQMMAQLLEDGEGEEGWDDELEEGEDEDWFGALEDDEGDDWFDELEEGEDEEFDSAAVGWLEITSYEQLPAYPSANDVYWMTSGSYVR
jgi:hypothetical protein